MLKELRQTADSAATEVDNLQDAIRRQVQESNPAMEDYEKLVERNRLRGAVDHTAESPVQKQS